MAGISRRKVSEYARQVNHVRSLDREAKAALQMENRQLRLEIAELREQLAEVRRQLG